MKSAMTMTMAMAPAPALAPLEIDGDELMSALHGNEQKRKREDRRSMSRQPQEGPIESAASTTPGPGTDLPAVLAFKIQQLLAAMKLSAIDFGLLARANPNVRVEGSSRAKERNKMADLSLFHRWMRELGTVETLKDILMHINCLEASVRPSALSPGTAGSHLMPARLISSHTFFLTHVHLFLFPCFACHFSPFDF